jgi:hypothetical protein
MVTAALNSVAARLPNRNLPLSQPSTGGCSQPGSPRVWQLPTSLTTPTYRFLSSPLQSKFVATKQHQETTTVARYHNDPEQQFGLVSFATDTEGNDESRRGRRSSFPTAHGKQQTAYLHTDHIRHTLQQQRPMFSADT